MAFLRLGVAVSIPRQALTHRYVEQNMSINAYGRTMVIAGWILFLLLLAWLFQGVLDQHFNPNQNPESIHSGEAMQVVLMRNRSAHYVATGEINGRRVNFLVDTGATDVAMSESIARRVGISQGAPVTLSTANGLVRGFRGLANSVSVGEIVIKKVPVVVTPGIQDDVILLGMSFLKHLELVQRDGMLILRQLR